MNCPKCNATMFLLFISAECPVCDAPEPDVVYEKVYCVWSSSERKMGHSLAGFFENDDAPLWPSLNSTYDEVLEATIDATCDDYGMGAFGKMRRITVPWKNIRVLDKPSTGLKLRPVGYKPSARTQP